MTPAPKTPPPLRVIETLERPDNAVTLSFKATMPPWQAARVVAAVYDAMGVR